MSAIMGDTALPIRIMLVDDHKALLWGLERLIDGQAPRMQVVGMASTCEEAVRRAASLAPDLILLDIDLAGQSALDILPTLIGGNVAKVLLFTATCDMAIINRAVAGGARGVLHKSAESGVVLKAIEKIMAGELWLDNQTLTRVFFEMMTPRHAKPVSLQMRNYATLTHTEKKIVEAVREGAGAPSKVLAQRLFILVHTLRNHLTAIYEKLGLKNRLELYIFAKQNGISD